MMTRRLTGVVAALAASLVFGAAAGSADADAVDWQSKVSDSVLTAAAAGETEFMVYMREQADLSGAVALGTKEAKGQFVYDRLTDLADRSQSGLLAQLAGLGVEHKSFWIVNTVHVKGGADVLQAVASRADVDAPWARGASTFRSRRPTTRSPPAPSTPSARASST
jgi:serine protease AprX